VLPLNHLKHQEDCALQSPGTSNWDILRDVIIKLSFTRRRVLLKKEMLQNSGNLIIRAVINLHTTLLDITP
jgi:hypothetical protein